MIKVLKKEAWSLNQLQLKTRDELIRWLNSSNKVKKLHKCPQCSSKKLKVISKVDRFGLNFKAVFCKKCSLIFTNPHIKEKYLGEYYDKYYHDIVFGTKEVLEHLFSSSQGNKIFHRVFRFLMKKNISVFEVGAGSGGNLKAFSNEAKNKNIQCNLEGLEYSQKYCEQAKKDDIVLHSTSLASYKKTNKYDVVILSHVFEHVVRLDEFLKDIKKLMARDGLLYVEVPGVLNIHSNHAYSYEFKKYLIHAHIYHFTAKTLQNILIRNGFEILTINERVEVVARLGRRKPKKIASNSLKYLKQLSSFKKCIPTSSKKEI